jgi:hypothetical protein
LKIKHKNSINNSEFETKSISLYAMLVEKKWILRESADPETVGRLSSELGVDPVLAELLVLRGVNTFAQARSFFRPSLDNLYDPFLMTDMDKAVERVRQAVTGSEKILVYGDYDVDGTTAVALLYTFIRNFNPNVEYYIPDRYDEGYGISYKGIDWGVDNGYTLIIALDCGIKAVEKVSYAKEKGVEPNEKQLAISRPLLVRVVNAYIVRNILNDEGFFPLFERDDDITKKAIETLTATHK